MSKQIILLHGWSDSAPEKLKHLSQELSRKGWQSTIITLPGFGNQPQPPGPWGVIDYARYVVKKCQQLGCERPVLFGHSFGGQIAAVIAARRLMPVSGLVLCESAALRKRGIVVTLAIHSTRFLPPWLKRYTRAIWEVLRPNLDYNLSSPRMKSVLTKVLVQDLTTLLPEISTDTLIYWGEVDRTLPLELGRETAKLIRNSELVVVPNATHTLPYTHAPQIADGITAHYK